MDSIDTSEDVQISSFSEDVRDGSLYFQIIRLRKQVWLDIRLYRLHQNQQQKI